jgi:hypothetical protein
VADSGNPEDLVSQVQVLGTEEGAAKLDAYAASGAKAFDKINVSAAAASKGVEASAAKIEASNKIAAASFNKLEGTGSRLSLLPGHIKNIENAVSNLTSKLPRLTQAVGRFSQRLALVGAGAVAAGVGLAAAAAKIAKASDTHTSALEEQTKAQIEANNSSLQGQIGAINLESSQRKLLQQVFEGKITYAQYSEQLKELNKDYVEQQRVAREVENAQERVRLENERLTKQAADTKAFQAQIDLFGGPLLSSLVQLGRQSSALFAEMKQTFGPVIAKGIDLVSSALSTNGQAISAFFTTAAAKLNNLLTNSGPQIQKLFENIAKASSAIFLGIIDAAPGVIDFFNNVLVPAITKVGSAFTGLASAINLVFGTKLTGGSLILIVILAQMTGAIRLLFAVVRVGNGVFKGFISIIEQIGIAIAEVFGFRTVAKIVAIGGAATKSGGPFKTLLAVIRTSIPLIVSLGTALAATLGIGFVPAIAVILAVAAALIFLVTKVDWRGFATDAQAALSSVGTFLTALVANAKIVALGIIGAFQTVNAFFNNLPTQIGQVFAGLWALIVSGAAAAASLFTSAWDAVSQFFSNIAQSIASFFSTLWDGIVAAAKVTVAALLAVWGPVSEGITTVFGAVVAFFQGVPATLQAVWDTVKQAIVSAFTTAVETVTTLFQTLLARAKDFLNPIIDLLKAIVALTATVSTEGDAGAVKAAGGGHIRGPGTGTSDSIPAWLSNNEFVMRARAVAKYGVGFMRAVNTGTFRLPGFNLGGLVSGMIGPTPRLAYADGGEVRNPASMRPINLSLLGEQFNGLLAPEDVGERLTKFAISRQTRSTGRKPAWLGRGRN